MVHDGVRKGGGNDFIIASDRAIKGARITTISGSGAAHVLAKATLSGDAKLASEVARSVGASDKTAARFATGSKVFWGLGRVLFAAAVAKDTYEIYQSEQKARTITSVVGGWTGMGIGARAGGWAGAKIGAGGAAIAGQLGPQAAAPEEVVTVPVAGAVGAVVGTVGGAIGGYIYGREITETVYDSIFQRGAQL